MRDYQQSKVYAWEQTLPNDKKKIPYDQIQDIINNVWSEMGLKYPPILQPLAKQTRKWAGCANRTGVWLPENGSTYQTILHELAHSMTMDIDGLGHQHNDVFVGVYMTLMEKFMNIPIFLLWASAEKCGVNYVKFAKPRITDGNEFYE